jgi:protein SERAC1
MKVTSSDRLLDDAADLLNGLSGDRGMEHAPTRPLIFVAHSLGGLVVKKALLLSHNNSKKHLKQIFDHTKGIAFVGTPHSDSFMVEWAKIPAAVLGLVNFANTSLLQDLPADNRFLKAIQVEFLHLVRGFNRQRLDIISFSEQHPYPVVGSVVSKDSATLPGYNSVSIPGNHQDMVKFSSAQDQGYQQLYQQLWRWESEIKSG